MGKYTPLGKHLDNLNQSRVKYSFTDIEKIIGEDLPPTAREKPQWWENNPEGHTQAKNGWLDVGWEVENVNIQKEEVIFRK